MEDAKKGNITPEMEKISKKENINIEKLVNKHVFTISMRHLLSIKVILPY